MTRRFRCRNTFRRVSFESFWLTSQSKKLRSAESCNASLLLPALYGDCVQQNCVPSLLALLPALQAVFAGKIDDRLK